MLVHPDNTAYDTTVVLKMRMPIRVTEHYVWRAVRAMLIGVVEDAAKIGLNAQYVEVVPAHDIDPGAGGIFARVQSHLIDGKACQAVEAAVAIAQIEIVGIGLVHGTFVSVLDSVEAFRARHVQGAKDQPVHYAKYHRIRANCQGQGQNGDDRESRRLAQDAKTK